MAKTYTANSYNIGSPAGTTIGNGKSMLALANTHVSNLVKVWRVWCYPNTTAVTGIVAFFNLRRFTTMSGGTAVTPVAHDSANVSKDLTNITASTGATITSPTNLFKFPITTEDVVLSGTNLPTLLASYNISMFWDAGLGDSNVQPIVLRQNEGFDVLCASNSVAGNFDIIFEFTVE